jgi:DNA topoisomerase-1
LENRYIQNWPEEKISVENARWGPQIKFGKLQLKLIKNGGGKFTPDELAALTLDEVKAMIVAQVPKAFDKKGAKKAAPKKAKVVKLAGEPSTKKAAVKKAASKKTAPKKVAAKKAPAKKAAAKKK